MNHIKWAWQRVTRGYDDRLFWSMDEYLDPIIRAGLTHIRKEGLGYPNGLTKAKWNKILDTMIAGFQPEPNIMTSKEWKKWVKNKQKALTLFALYYNQLWD